MPKIIVLDADVCGLAAGMLLAYDGHEVTVLASIMPSSARSAMMTSPGLRDASIAAGARLGIGGLLDDNFEHGHRPGLARAPIASMFDAVSSSRTGCCRPERETWARKGLRGNFPSPIGPLTRSARPT
jgi:hypothetical protein